MAQKENLLLALLQRPKHRRQPDRSTAGAKGEVRPPIRRHGLYGERTYIRKMRQVEGH